ncbi:PD-(D/E)XK nuclease family protein [Granulosicoccus antarcticus]|uniref:ATP-dependent helicase/deoxyribonuclease subunit B n=1 Tax=Granulosicoccus antarcticus IMCC3135 TaxID=1192854 RepID=A0A2Z2NYM0_9GAMM|nr:PD-(D/E)XK nuclease family protein [Granulosicoccus antarcticus]ASJ76413.1 ATP-dependent helicase/deoxyribonuclease subunit B [Granulosicoccus antarcticus IMCC3135]
MNDHSQQLASGAVLITVNQRLARHHLGRYQSWQLSQGQLWWETPSILPLRAWLRALHAEALAKGLSSRTLLPDLLQQKVWRQCIAADKNLELLDVDAATSAARSAWELSCAWQCRNPEDDYLPKDQYTWQHWCSTYLQWLDRESSTDEASLANHMIEVFESPEGASLLPERMIFEGFLELPPQLVMLTEALERAGVSVELATRQSNAFVQKQSYADDEQEMLSIAQHMRHELERDPNQSLGLVVPDLQQKRTVVMRAFDRVFFPVMSPDQIRAQGRPYDLSLGMPLSDTSVVTAALSLIRLCSSKVRGSEISAVLLSPYLKAAASEARRREQLDRRLRDVRVRSLTLEQLLGHLYPGSRLERLIRELIERRELDWTTLSGWAARFSDWLTVLGWPGESVDTEEYQAFSAWLECLDDMQLLDDGERVGVDSALHILQELARERIFQLDTPSTPIQIMGRLESHGIDFDCLWVAGLDTEQWPPSGSPSPFLSMAAQKEQGVPGASAAARLALAEREFLMWSSQAPLLIGSRAELRDGKALEAASVPEITSSDPNRELAASRLDRMQDLPAIADPVKHLQSSLCLESIVDDKGPELEAGSEVKGGARLFENQALCPFRAFALHRLQIRPLEEAGLGLDPRQHGTLLHAALELFWKAVRSHEALIQLSDEERGEKVLEVIDQAIIEAQVPAELQSLERIRLSELLEEWLTQSEIPRQAFEVVSLEQRQSLEHGGIVMNVMLDRIDRVGNDLVVIDYKTGTSNRVNTWADERIINPQLPLYVLTNDDIQGAIFAQVARNQTGFKGVASDAMLIPKVKTTVMKSRNGQATERPLEDWNDWRAHWREALDVVAAEVRQGTATITPIKTACLHCELKSLCRIDEVVLAKTTNDEDEVTSDSYAGDGA